MKIDNNKTHTTAFTAPLPGEHGRILLYKALHEAKDLLNLQSFVIADEPMDDGRYMVTFSDFEDVGAIRIYA